MGGADFNRLEFSSRASARPMSSIRSPVAVSTQTFTLTRPFPVGIAPRDVALGEVYVTEYRSTAAVLGRSAVASPAMATTAAATLTSIVGPPNVAGRLKSS
jgi:hypothetical protein